MGGVQSNPGPVQVNVQVPSKGNKVLKSKFTYKAPDVGMAVKDYFSKIVRPMVEVNGSACGDLVRVTIFLRGSTEEVEIDSLDDDASSYSDMGLTKTVFHVEQDVWPVPREMDVATGLVRERRLELPLWAHAGRPALTQLFSDFRQALQKDGLGFAGSADLKIGCEWMQNVTKVLYELSPFHSKLKSRGRAVPDAFAFSDGANNFKKKGKAEPQMTQDILRTVSHHLPCAQSVLSLCPLLRSIHYGSLELLPPSSQALTKLASVCVYPHLDMEPWTSWRTHLADLHDCVNHALDHMISACADKQARLQKQTAGGLMFRTIDELCLSKGVELREATKAMKIKYIEVDKALKGLLAYHPLSLTFFEPTGHSERYRWLRDLQVSFPVALLKMTVGGVFGVLVWIMKRDEDLIELGDEDEIKDAEALIRPAVPRVRPALHRTS